MLALSGAGFWYILLIRLRQTPPVENTLKVPRFFMRVSLSIISRYDGVTRKEEKEMRKLFLTLCSVIVCMAASGQAYRQIRIADEVSNTHNSYSGVEVRTITPLSDGSYSVTLFNSNYNDPYDGVSYRTSYSFCWYLLYKGKRISDYYQSTIRCRASDKKNVWAWLDEVPKGYEKYVSVQLGREAVRRDSRDDD